MSCDQSVIDYRKPSTPRIRRRHERTLGEESFKLALLATVFITYGLSGNPDKFVHLFLFCGPIIWFSVGVILVTQTGAKRRVKAIGARWKLAIMIVLMMSFASVPLTMTHGYTCQHGLRWANNLFGVAKGRPCHNGSWYPTSYCWHVRGTWCVFTVIPG